MRKKFPWLASFNWRILLVRILIYSAALLVTAGLLPDIYFVNRTLLSVLVVAVVFGAVDAILKPILQALTFQLIFASFGFVLILVNAIMLWALGWLLPDRFAVDSVIWALVGGALVGILASFLEALLGVTTPLVPSEDAELRALISNKPPVLEEILEKRQPGASTEVGVAVPPPEDEPAPLLVEPELVPPRAIDTALQDERDDSP
jgi:putative membrane protein